MSAVLPVLKPYREPRMSHKDSDYALWYLHHAGQHEHRVFECRILHKLHQCLTHMKIRRLKGMAAYWQPFETCGVMAVLDCAFVM